MENTIAYLDTINDVIVYVCEKCEERDDIAWESLHKTSGREFGIACDGCKFPAK